MRGIPPRQRLGLTACIIIGCSGEMTGLAVFGFVRRRQDRQTVSDEQTLSTHQRAGEHSRAEKAAPPGQRAECGDRWRALEGRELQAMGRERGEKGGMEQSGLGDCAKRGGAGLETATLDTRHRGIEASMLMPGSAQGTDGHHSLHTYFNHGKTLVPIGARGWGWLRPMLA